MKLNKEIHVNFFFFFSPTKHSKLDVLTNVKNQIGGSIGGIGGWLPTIPKFRKGEGEHGETEEPRPTGEEEATLALEKPIKGSPVDQKDEDDNSR